MSVLKFLFCSLLIVPCFRVRQATALSPSAEEMATAADWLHAHLAADSILAPFSFIYDGKPSTELLKNWDCRRQSRKLDDNRTEYRLIYRDRKTDLVLTCRALAYHDFPTVEWTLHFQNIGTIKTPRLKQIYALDTFFQCDTAEQFRLHHFAGGFNSPGAYQPFAIQPPRIPHRLDSLRSLIESSNHSFISSLLALLFL